MNKKGIIIIMNPVTILVIIAILIISFLSFTGKLSIVGDDELIIKKIVNCHKG